MSTTLTRRRMAHSASLPAQSPMHVPAVLPMITITVESDATLSVTVDGEILDPPAFAPRWERHSVAQLISGVIEQRRSPVRVVINEQDGSVYTDIVTHPIAGTRACEAPTPVPADSSAEIPVHLFAVQGEEGFVPGEQVAVAVIIRHVGADTDGSARSLIEPGLMDLTPSREVILFGRMSGTCVIGQPT